MPTCSLWCDDPATITPLHLSLFLERSDRVPGAARDGRVTFIFAGKRLSEDEPLSTAGVPHEGTIHVVHLDSAACTPRDNATLERGDEGYYELQKALSRGYGRFNFFLKIPGC